ncbi:hypothetical protein [Methylophaga sulfidovorans]|uniref:Uncharacterized protein n=1 Tax=Methylophaga sulfidovorans TaxID=45496 RepID=A0A1I3UKU6_9GAMM|nr:hypothetical protein [Methylophaga sulfidovorans]SFJ83515.1 hypothetical protein SAMN04488079_1024 [Methylophaga sulfidovorans]
MSTFDEVYDFECKVFEPETAELSQKEIKSMLQQLYKYFPYTEHEGKRKPYEPSSDYSKKWFQSYNHLLMLLDMKKQEAKHNISMWLSVLAIVVSVTSVLVRVGSAG